MWNTSDSERDLLTADDISLENFLSPFSYGQETPLSTFQQGSSIHSRSSRGFISQDCQWGCCYSRNSIKCFPVDSYASSGQYVRRGNVPVTISTTSFHFEYSSITCATELAIHNHKTVLGIRKILLGLKVRENDDLHGALVIFDPIRSLPMKWIILPSPVSSVTVLSHYEEGGSTRPFFNEAMLTMVGIAAVGMQGGQVLIVDLGLDDPNLSNWDHALTSGVHRYHVLPVDPHELLIAMKRHNVVTKNNLICVDLISEHQEESENENDYFFYCSPENSVLCALEKDTIAVTCLEYIPATGSLVVGYSFGCFQIWGVDSATLLYSSSVPSPEVSHEVFGFAFQQPVDDPRNICYLWVLFGKRTLEMHQSHAELHGLVFNNKSYNENFGFSYEEFRQCGKRLSIRLEDYFDTGSESDMENSTDEQAYPSQRYSVRPIKMWSHSDHQTFFSWESNRNGVYYVGIFDLNQWYSNHTSEKIRYTSIGLCPYWVAIPVETVDRFATVWDVGIVPKSIESWENPHLKLDLHLYPASLTFRGVCLSSTGTSTFEFFGIQEKLLRLIQKNGPDMMVDPGQFRNLCQTYGLQPVFSHCYDDLASQQDADRFFILSILLESRRSSFILEMANKWIDGSYANVGCSVDLLLNWISSFTCGIRLVADEHWENLLSFRNEILPPATAHFINYSNFIWHALLGVLNMLMRPNEVYESHTSHLEDLKFALEKFVQYSAALLMFYKARVLPEVDDHQFVSIMSKYYEQRRIDVKGALQNCEFLDPEIKSSNPLLIDYLLENFDEKLLREQWNLEPGESLYPPKHIGYILNMFMWAHEYPKAISRIIAYYLIDLSSIINETVKLRGDFASIIQLSTEEQTEIYNLWALDRGSCHEVLLFLSQKDRLHESDELPWCAAVVLLTALGHGDSVVELLQKSCPPKLGRLYFNLMTTSRAKYNFLIDDICSTRALMESNHLQNFFEVSDNHNLLGEFVKAKSCSAPEVVTDALVEYLQSHNNFENCDRLLSYYIHKEDWDKLREQYSSIKTKSISWKLTSHQKSIWLIRQKLVESLLKPTRKDFQKFISESTPQIANVCGPTRKIKVHHVKRPFAISSPLENIRAKSTHYEIKLPPQLRNLKLHESVATCSLSPMKGQTSGLHAVIGSNGRNDANNAATSTHTSSASIRLSSGSPDSPTSNSFDRRKSSFRSSSRISFGGRSPINLTELLKTPAVDHRYSRRHKLRDFESPERAENNETIYGTPGDDRSSTSSVHSIMKKQDSLRKFVCRKGLRFLEFTSTNERDTTQLNDSDVSEDRESDKDVKKSIKGVDDQKDNSDDARSSLNEDMETDKPNDDQTISDEENKDADDELMHSCLDDTLFEDSGTGNDLVERNSTESSKEASETDMNVAIIETYDDSSISEIKTMNNTDVKSVLTENTAENEQLSYQMVVAEEDKELQSERTEPSDDTDNTPTSETKPQDMNDNSVKEQQTVNKESSGNKDIEIVEVIQEEENEEVPPLPNEEVSQSKENDKEATNVEVLQEDNPNENIEYQPVTEKNNPTQSVEHRILTEVKLENNEIRGLDVAHHQSEQQEEADVHKRTVSDEEKSDDVQQALNKAVLDNESVVAEAETLNDQVGASEVSHQQMRSETLLENGDTEIVENELTQTEQDGDSETHDNFNQALLEYSNNTLSLSMQPNMSQVSFDENCDKTGVEMDSPLHDRPDVTLLNSSRNGSEGTQQNLDEALLEDESGTEVKSSDVSISERSLNSSPSSLGRMTRSQSRRRSMTPESETSFRVFTSDKSDKRVTRSQARKESEFDVSENEDSVSIFDATGDDTPKSSLSSRKGRGGRNTRSRSKTPSLLPVVKEDAELTIEPEEVVAVVKAKSTKKKEKKIPKKDETTSSDGESVKPRRKRKINAEPPVEESEATVVKVKATRRKRKGVEKEKTPVKEEESSADESSSSKSTSIQKRRQLQIYDYAPGLSTIVEDSDQSYSVLQETVVTPELSPPKSRARKARDPKSVTPDKEKITRRRRHDAESDDDSKSDISATSSRSVCSTSTPELSLLADSDHSFSFLSATVVEPRRESPKRIRGRSKEPKDSPSKTISAQDVEKEKDVKRRKKEVDSDDDAKSDISVASSRGSRSTASRKSTDRTLPKRVTRSSKK